MEPPQAAINGYRIKTLRVRCIPRSKDTAIGDHKSEGEDAIMRGREDNRMGA
ncbi:MAG: hypothetical protein ACYTEM_02770 [Planctomycetota bacterium]|jgi:hypothetical protein